MVFNIDIPITKGYSVVLHYGCVSEQATVSKLYSLLRSKTNEKQKTEQYLGDIILNTYNVSDLSSMYIVQLVLMYQTTVIHIGCQDKVGCTT